MILFSLFFLNKFIVIEFVRNCFCHASLSCSLESCEFESN